MHCEQSEMLLPLLVFDELVDARKAELMAHLGSCQACSEKLGDLRVTMNLLREGVAAAPAPMFAPQRRQRLLKKLARRPRRSRRDRKPSRLSPLGIIGNWNFRSRALAAAAGIALVAGVSVMMLPSLGTARRTARQMQGSTQVRSIQSGLAMEAQGNNDVYPQDLGALVANDAIPPEYLISPQDAGSVRVPADFNDWSAEKRSTWANENSSYYFVRPGEKVTNDSRRIVAFEKPSPDKPGISVVYDDNHAEYVPMGQAKDLIKANTGKTAEQWGEALAFRNAVRNPSGRNTPSSPAIVAEAQPQTGETTATWAYIVPDRSPEDVTTWYKREAQGQSVNGHAIQGRPLSTRMLYDETDHDASDKLGISLSLNAPQQPPVLAKMKEESLLLGTRIERDSDRLEAVSRDALPLVAYDPAAAVAGVTAAPLPTSKSLASGVAESETDGAATTRFGVAVADDAPADPLARKYANDAALLYSERTKAGVPAPAVPELKGIIGPSSAPSSYGSAPDAARRSVTKSPRIDEELDAYADFSNKTGGVEGLARRGNRGDEPMAEAFGLSEAPAAKDGSAGPKVQYFESKLKEIDVETAAGTARMKDLKLKLGELSDREETPLSVLGSTELDLRPALKSTALRGLSLGEPSTAKRSGESNERGEQVTREEKVEQLATLIQDTMGTQSEWAAYGGQLSSVREHEDKLIIKATPKQQREIAALLTKLRSSDERSSDQPGAFDGVAAEPEVNRFDLAGRGEDRLTFEKLQQKISLNADGKRLQQVVRELAEKSGSNVVVNWGALEAAGVEQSLPITLAVKDVPAEKAIELVLRQAGGQMLEPIDYEVLDGIVNVSTRRDLQRFAETRVYDVRDLLRESGPADDPLALFRKSKVQEAEALSERRQLEAAEQAQIQQKLSQMHRIEPPAAAPPAPADDDSELQPAANFKLVPVNPWTLAQQDAQSTFGLDVDTASYTLGRRYITRGYLPPAGSVRMEEYINAFDYNYESQCDNVFRMFAEAGPAPFAPADAPGTRLLKIGVKGKVIGRDGRKPANLVFVIDTSGSMARPDRLPMVQHALELLTSQLTPSDTVSLVTFGAEVLTLLDGAPASQQDAIRAAIRSLQASGPTNLLKGVEAGYQVARQVHRSGSINRVILCSDGIATLGETEGDAILSHVENYRKQGISCTTVGFGAGAYDDDMMEKLANKGDGSYYFVDSRQEARRVFVDELTATLATIARDAKIQVEFNPQRVRRYRLIGYENRAIADQDFRNDTIDAGEVGSGQSSTALYEIELTGDADDGRGADLGTVYVRYRDADTQQIEEIAQRLGADLVGRRTVQEAPRFYLAACAAEFAEILRESEHAAGGSLGRVQDVLEQVAPQLPLDEKAAELLDLVRKAQGLPRAP